MKENFIKLFSQINLTLMSVVRTFQMILYMVLNEKKSPLLIYLGCFKATRLCRYFCFAMLFVYRLFNKKKYIMLRSHIIRRFGG